jgi:hypothetical protein
MSEIPQTQDPDSSEAFTHALIKPSAYRIRELGCFGHHLVEPLNRQDKALAQSLTPASAAAGAWLAASVLSLVEIQ